MKGKDIEQKYWDLSALYQKQNIIFKEFIWDKMLQ